MRSSSYCFEWWSWKRVPSGWRLHHYGGCFIRSSACFGSCQISGDGSARHFCSFVTTMPWVVGEEFARRWAVACLAYIGGTRRRLCLKRQARPFCPGCLWGPSRFQPLNRLRCLLLSQATVSMRSRQIVFEAFLFIRRRLGLKSLSLTTLSRRRLSLRILLSRGLRCCGTGRIWVSCRPATPPSPKLAVSGYCS